MLMELDNEVFDVLYGGENNTGCINRCEGCFWNMNNDDCFKWSSIDGIGYNEKGEPMVVACSAWQKATETENIFEAMKNNS